jgi:hypothetical protein
LDSESGFFRSGIGDGVEKDGDPAFCFKPGMDFIACERSDGLRSLSNIRRCDETSVLQDGRGTTERIPCKIVTEIEEMGSEHPEIERSSAGVFFSSRPDLEPASDRSVFDQFCNNRENRMIAIAMSDRESGALFFACGNDGIGLDEISAERFFHVDSFRSGVYRRKYHVMMLIDMARADRDEIGFHFRQHLPVVGVPCALLKFESIECLCQAGFDGIGYTGDVCLRKSEPDGIQSMPEIAPTAMSHDSNGPGFVLRPEKGRGRNECAEGDGAPDKVTTGRGWDLHERGILVFVRADKMKGAKKIG